MQRGRPSPQTVQSILQALNDKQMSNQLWCLLLIERGYLKNSLVGSGWTSTNIF
jgi:hypothetical protein